MLGRFLLLWLNRKVSRSTSTDSASSLIPSQLGKHRALFIYAFMTNG